MSSRDRLVVQTVLETLAWVRAQTITEDSEIVYPLPHDLQGMIRDLGRDADDLASGACPLCEEVECDEDCPIREPRAHAAQRQAALGSFPVPDRANRVRARLVLDTYMRRRG